MYLLHPNDPETVGRAIQARGRLGDVVAARAAHASYLASLPEGTQAACEVRGALDELTSLERAQLCYQPDQSQVPFVGRATALASAWSFMSSVQAGEFSMLAMSGESGIGKTRILDEIHREGVVRGFRCLRAQLVELEQAIPLNPLIDALCQVDDLDGVLQRVGRPWSSVISSLLPPGQLPQKPTSRPPPIQATSLSRRLLDSFALVFEQLANDKPTLILLDDFHWADKTTVTTLQFLQRRWTKGPLGIVATYRPELLPTRGPITAYLQRGEVSRPQHEIDLRPMDADDAVELVRALGGESISPLQARRLCSIAGHHPLYLTELTRDFLMGSLTLPARPSDEIRIPTSLAQMLDARLEAMDEPAMCVAGVLAVAAKSLRVGAIRELTGLSPDDTANAIDALTAARFVRVDGNQVKIVHDLFRSAVYRHMSVPRRAVHHRAIAAHLLLEAPDDAAGELSIHFARAGNGVEAARYGWQAAVRALEAGALAEAIRFLRVVTNNERDPVKAAAAATELARALHVSRDITRANPELRDAAVRLRTTGQPAQARRLEILRVDGLAEVRAAPVQALLEQLRPIKMEAYQAGDWEGVALALDVELQFLHRAGDLGAIQGLFDELRNVAQKEPLEARVLSRTGLALGVFFDDPVEALHAAKDAVGLASECRGYRLKALNRLLVVLQARGLLMKEEWSSYVAEARALADQSGDPLARFKVESNIAVAHLDAGEVERAEVLFGRADRVAGRGEMHINRFIQANNEAELAMARQDYEAATRSFSRAASFLGLTTPRYMQDLVNAGLGHCALECGNLAEAREREALLHPPPQTWYFDPTTILAFQARLMERRGRTADAIGLLEQHAADLEDRLTLAWMKVMFIQVRLTASRSASRARSLARLMAGRARELNLVRRAEQFDALGSNL
ncbi:MAG: AAA family ATPase [Gemmatimonadota bacterium]